MQSPSRLIHAVFAGGLLVLLIRSCCWAQTCDPDYVTVTPIEDIEMDRLMGKKWYVQEIFVRRQMDLVEPNYSCFMHYIIPFIYENEGQLTEIFTDLASGAVIRNASNVMYPSLGDNKAVWYVMGEAFWDQYVTIYTHTDYESYGIMHWCPLPDAAHEYERIMTFTGVPDPKPQLLAKARALVESLGFPTNYGVQIQHHADCDYGLCDLANGDCCDPAVVNVPPLPDVDFQRLFDKWWYVQEIFFRERKDAFAPPCYIQTLRRHDASPGRIKIEEIIREGTGFAVRYEYYVTPEAAGGNKAVWEVTRTYTLNKFTTVMTHTDYETYAVIHWCPFPENADFNSERIFIYTGTPTPDPGLVRQLRSMVSSLGFPLNNSAPVAHPPDCYSPESFGSSVAGGDGQEDSLVHTHQ